MSWLAPIGFLGLLGIVALVIIYVIRPNYQNKYISSTFVWRLSLGYRKKTVPISKIQSILTFLAQALILAILGTMLAGPSLASAGSGDANEAVIIVDASAGMRISDSQSDTTRFSRALTEAKKKAIPCFPNGFCSFGDETVASGFTADGKTYLAVWGLKSDLVKIGVS